MERVPFRWIGPPAGLSPVVVAVPHGGRGYPDDIAARLRLSLDEVVRLEDRYVDLVAQGVAATGVPVLIADTPRLLIDLNRAEDDLDPGMLADPPQRWFAPVSVRARGGLGLIPRRLPRGGELWRERIAMAEVNRRIETVHRPWHATLAKALDRARPRHGRAVLIDLHSMPSLPPRAGTPQPVVVIGDRHGVSASDGLRRRLVDVAREQGFAVAVNDPYAGGHAVVRHGAPHRGIEAVQVELDRRLYLTEAGQVAHDGLARCAALLCAMVDAARDIDGGWAEAAE